MSFARPGFYAQDEDGFAPPNFGGTLAVKYGTVAYTDTTAKALFSLPANAVPIGWITNVDEAFDDSGTDLLDLGDGTTADRFAADLDVSSAGQIVTGYDETEIATPLTEETTFYGTYTGQNSDASTGNATVIVFFILL